MARPNAGFSPSGNGKKILLRKENRENEAKNPGSSNRNESTTLYTTTNTTPSPHTETHIKDQLGKGIVNLSTKILTVEESEVLNLGLKFIPTPHRTTPTDIAPAITQFTRKLRIIHHFRHDKSHYTRKPFVGKSRWTPPITDFPLEAHEIVSKLNLDVRKLKTTYEKPNLSKEQRNAIKTLKHHQTIVLRKADKGTATVVMEKDDYIREVNRQLADRRAYKKLDEPIHPLIRPRLFKILNKLHSEGFIDNKQRAYLLPPKHPRARHLYTLPKIHKDPASWTVPFKIPPGRPIVSDCSSDTYNISEYIDHYLAPLATKHAAYLKDTYHFIDIIKHTDVPQHALLITLDVDNMYTNIDNTEGLRAVKRAFSENPDNGRPDQEILELLKLNLENNDFQFDNDWYVQVMGTAMGKKFAPNYANIFMAGWEREVLAKCAKSPLTYLRYLDDIFIIWPHSRAEFEEFFNTLNNSHPSIKLKACISEHSINFLDTIVFKGNNFQNTHRLSTKVYFKPTDTHQLLHRDSFHPKHTTRGILKSQIIRFLRICSDPQDFKEACQVLFQVLQTRGYSKRFLREVKSQTIKTFFTDNEMQKIYQSQSHQPKPVGTNSTANHSPTTSGTNRSVQIASTNTVTQANPQARTNTLSFIIKYSNLATQAANLVKKSFATLQQLDPGTFSQNLVIAYSKNKNLSDLLIRNRFSSNRENNNAN